MLDNCLGNPGGASGYAPEDQVVDGMVCRRESALVFVVESICEVRKCDHSFCCPVPFAMLVFFSLAGALEHARPYQQEHGQG